MHPNTYLYIHIYINSIDLSIQLQQLQKEIEKEMQKQRKIDELYVNQAVNNMGYIYKQLYHHIIIDNKLVNILLHSSLNKPPFVHLMPFEIVTIPQSHSYNYEVLVTSYYLSSLVQIGKNNYHEIIIGIHNNFPQGPPIFLLSINRAFKKIVFRINKERQMITNKEIILEKDQTGMQFIRFNFSFLSTTWRPMTTLLDVYKQFHTVISSPPILIEISSQNFNSWQNLHQSNKNTNNLLLNNYSNQIVNNLPGLAILIDSQSVELSNIFSTLQQLQSHQENLTYQEARNNYLVNYHLKELQVNLKSKSDQLTSKTLQVKQMLDKSKEKSLADDFLLVAQSSLLKLQYMAEKQALKEAEKKVKETLQKQLQNGKKYSQYKKIIRSLFTQMYDNQSKILQNAQ